MEIITFNDYGCNDAKSKKYALVYGEVLTAIDEVIYYGVIIKPVNLTGKLVSIMNRNIINIFHTDDWKPYLVIKSGSKLDFMSVVFVNSKKKQYLYNNSIIGFENFPYKNVIEITQSNWELINILRNNILKSFRIINITPFQCDGFYPHDEKYFSNYQGITSLQTSKGRSLNSEFVFKISDDFTYNLFSSIIKNATTDELRNVLLCGTTPFSKWILSFRNIDAAFDKGVGKMKFSEIENESKGINKIIAEEWKF